MGLDHHAHTHSPFIPPALLTVPEAMAALRLSRATVYDLIRSGALGSVKVGRSRRIPAQAITTFVARLVESQPLMAARKDRGRLPNGAGSIYQRASDSKWVGATYVLTTDGTRHRKVVYGASWEEAHTKLLAIQDRDRRGLPAPHDAPTVAEYLEYWLEQIVHVARRPATYAKYESMVRVHIAPHLGEKRLDRLTVADCQRFANARLAAGTSVTTVHTAVATLGAALNRAMREEVAHPQRRRARHAARRRRRPSGRCGTWTS